MSDVRHHPITMRMTAHEYSISCLCDSCQATLKKQSTCRHTMIGKQPICVFCGVSEQLATSIDMLNTDVRNVLPPTPFDLTQLLKGWANIIINNAHHMERFESDCKFGNGYEWLTAKRYQK